MFTENLIVEKVSIEPKYFGKNFKERAYYKLKNLEGRCVSNGYVKKNSLELINILNNKLDVFNFSGMCIATVQLKVNILNLIINQELECYIVSINEFGIRCSINKDQTFEDPVYILITKTHNQDTRNLKIGDKLSVKIIAKKFNLYDDQIFALGLII